MESIGHISDNEQQISAQIIHTKENDYVTMSPREVTRQQRSKVMELKDISNQAVYMNVSRQPDNTQVAGHPEVTDRQLGNQPTTKLNDEILQAKHWAFILIGSMFVLLVAVIGLSIYLIKNTGHSNKVNQLRQAVTCLECREYSFENSMRFDTTTKGSIRWGTSSATQSHVPEIDIRNVNKPLKGHVASVAALSDGGAAINNFIKKRSESYLRKLITESYIWKVNKKGTIIKLLYFCVCDIGGVLALKQNLYVLTHSYLLQVNPTTGVVIMRYKAIVGTNNALTADTENVDNPNIILWTGLYGKEVFIYNLTNKHVRLALDSGLHFLNSVSYIKYKHERVYIICHSRGHRVLMYNNNWSLIKSVGKQGQGDGKLDHPFAALPTMNGTFLVTDYNNHRISEFDLEGHFVQHVMYIKQPRHLSLMYPHLWLSSADSNILQFKLDQSK